MPVVHIVQYFQQPLWKVEVDDSHFGGHGFYKGEAARCPSVSLVDFLTKTAHAVEIAYMYILQHSSLGPPGKWFPYFLWSEFSYCPDMEICACVYGFLV